MESITISRTIDAPISAVRDAVTDIEPFMLAAGFDEVDVDGDDIDILNRVGIATIELSLERVDDPDAVLAYEQRDGIFESMHTAYYLDETEAGTRVEATTNFALDVALVGEMLDATIIKRQRRRELDAQFDHLEAVVGGGGDG